MISAAFLLSGSDISSCIASTGEMPSNAASSAGQKAAAQAASSGTIVSAFRRLVELSLMLLAALAAIFFYKSAEEKEKEKSRLEDELRRVRQQDGAGTKDRCVVCAGNPIEVLIEPCGHVAVCKECVRKMHKCPICRENMADWRQVFVS